MASKSAKTNQFIAQSKQWRSRIGKITCKETLEYAYFAGILHSPSTGDFQIMFNKSKRKVA